MPFFHFFEFEFLVFDVLCVPVLFYFALFCFLPHLHHVTTTARQINDTVGISWPWLYFVSLVVVGAFFIMNLILGTLCG